MARRYRLMVPFVLALAVAAACKKSSNRPETGDNPQQPAAAAAVPAASETETLPWRHDDYPKAMAAAKSAGVPVVVDMWAPWCHTCLSMQEFVLSDPSLAPLADRFVWAALDTDKEVNAPVLETLAVGAWPTFYVVSSVDSSIQARHVGAASVKQFREFLSQGESGHLEASGKSGRIASDSPLRFVRDGDRAVAAGDKAAAAAAYGKALDLGGVGWNRRPEIRVAQLNALASAGEYKACAALATRHMSEMSKVLSASAADFAYYAHTCADHLDEKSAASLRELAAADDGPIHSVLANPNATLSLDDRSDALHILREIEEKRGNTAVAKTHATRQRAILDQAAAEAPNAFAAMTYNWPRAEVYVYLEVAGELVPALLQSVDALPDQYDPPYRLAWIYLNLKRYDEALVMAERALKLAYGPRKGRVHELIANIHKATGDRAAERAARQAAVTLFEGLPPGQRRESTIDRARKELAAIEP